MRHPALRLVLAATLTATVLPALAGAAPGPADLQVAQLDLGAPVLSRVLGAVLLSDDDAVRRSFGLEGRAPGILVLAVDPQGLAARHGVAPGDILRAVRGRAVAAPADIDRLLREAAGADRPAGAESGEAGSGEAGSGEAAAGDSGPGTPIAISLERDGRPIAVDAVLPAEDAAAPVEVPLMTSWSSLQPEAEWAATVERYAIEFEQDAGGVATGIEDGEAGLSEEDAAGASEAGE